MQRIKRKLNPILAGAGLLLSFLPFQVQAQTRSREGLANPDFPSSLSGSRLLVLECRKCPDHHVETLGERAGFWGSVSLGFEAWAYPFKLFDGFEFLVSSDGGATYRTARETFQRQVVSPHMTQLSYEGQDWSLTQTLFVPRTLPGVFVGFEFKTQRDLEVRIRFRPSLAPMLLAESDARQSDWNAAAHELTVVEPGRQLRLQAYCPCAQSWQVTERGAEELHLKITAAAARAGTIPLVFGLGWPKGPDLEATMSALARDISKLERESKEHYSTLLHRAPQVVSPDAVVNEAMAWSVVSLDQLRVNNPYLGFGLVSGYSASGRGTRPRYCWFFEEPTLGSWAYLRAGLSRDVKESLRFLQRFQRKDGKTVHEVSQSLPLYTNYFKTYPYAYQHTDGPVYYLAAYGQYYRSSGDVAFIREQWPHVRQTVLWCFSVMDSKDGLLRIAEGDWGSAESSMAVSKDTQLEAMWVRALDDVARMALTMGDRELSDRCQKAAVRALNSIESELWNETAGIYSWGLDREGRRLDALIPHQAIGYWLSTLDGRLGADYDLVFAPELGPGARISSVTVNGRSWDYQVRSETSRTVVTLHLSGLSGPQAIRIRYLGGLEFLPVDDPLSVGRVSSGLRLIRSGLKGDTFSWLVEGLPNHDYKIDVFTDRHVVGTDGAEIDRVSKAGFRLVLRSPVEGLAHAARFVRWPVSVRFE